MCCRRRLRPVELLAHSLTHQLIHQATEVHYETMGDSNAAAVKTNPVTVATSDCLTLVNSSIWRSAQLLLTVAELFETSVPYFHYYYYQHVNIIFLTVLVVQSKESERPTLWLATDSLAAKCVTLIIMSQTDWGVKSLHKWIYLFSSRVTMCVISSIPVY